MKRLVIPAIGLCLSLAGVGGSALAQEKDVPAIVTNADGSSVRSTAGLNPTANGAGGTIVYGDINTGPGGTIITPPSTIIEAAPPAAAGSAPAPEAVAAPVAEPVPVPADTAIADTAVATATDLDADNYPDELEWNLGLDPNNADTDADGVADGDELNIYGTDPTVFDTDGDGVGDGEELFGILTDPLTWNDFSVDAAASETQSQTADDAIPTSVGLTQGTSEVLTATDGNASALGTGNASAAPGTVTRDGSSLPPILGPDGTYNVVDTAPPNVTIAGDTEVLAPPAASAPGVAGCGDYASWYDAQVAYEAAGMLDADPAIIAALDPDYDGIACEEGM
jgi:hypothetical protein